MAADVELQGLMDNSGLRETSISFRSPFHKILLDSPVFDMLISTSLFSNRRERYWLRDNLIVTPAIVRRVVVARVQTIVNWEGEKLGHRSESAVADPPGKSQRADPTSGLKIESPVNTLEPITYPM